MYGGRIGDSTIAPQLTRDKVVIFTAPTFPFWQLDNLRRYAGARAIVVATLDLGPPSAYRVRRETFWDSTGASDRMTKIGRFVRDYVAEVANLSQRPVVDQPKSEPNGLCRQ